MEIKDLIKNFHLVEIRTRKRVQGGLASSYRNVFRGQGLEFAEVREYAQGDDVRLIDWNVSARFGNLYVKQLLEERELNIITILQCSRSMDYGTRGKTKFELAAELASLIIFSAIHSGDRAGLLTFSGTGSMDFIPPGKGLNHGFILLNRIIEQPLSGPVPDLTQIRRFLTHGLRKKCVVFMVGDFLYSEWDPGLLEIPARRHDLICISVLDSSELEGPPAGIFPLTAGHHRWWTSMNIRSRQRYAEFVGKKLQQMESLFIKAGVDFLLIRTDDECEKELHGLFLRRGHVAGGH